MKIFSFIMAIIALFSLCVNAQSVCACTTTVTMTVVDSVCSSVPSTTAEIIATPLLPLPMSESWTINGPASIAIPNSGSITSTTTSTYYSTSTVTVVVSSPSPTNTNGNRIPFVNPNGGVVSEVPLFVPIPVTKSAGIPYVGSNSIVSVLDSVVGTEDSTTPVTVVVTPVPMVSSVSSPSSGYPMLSPHFGDGVSYTGYGSGSITGSQVGNSVTGNTAVSVSCSSKKSSATSMSTSTTIVSPVSVMTSSTSAATVYPVSSMTTSTSKATMSPVSVITSPASVITWTPTMVQPGDTVTIPGW